MIQALLLDLLQDVPDSAVEATGIADLADLLLLSSSAAIQCTAYRILSRVIRSRTLALVLDVEASVSKAEEGQASRTIALPEELVGIVRSGLAFDWYSEEAVSMVSVLENQHDTADDTGFGATACVDGHSGSFRRCGDVLRHVFW
jgi:hypothetical protein